MSLFQHSQRKATIVAMRSPAKRRLRMSLFDHYYLKKRRKAELIGMMRIGNSRSGRELNVHSQLIVITKI